MILAISLFFFRVSVSSSAFLLAVAEPLSFRRNNDTIHMITFTTRAANAARAPPIKAAAFSSIASMVTERLVWVGFWV
ncbi:hypothetical protein D3C87_1541250 [compost metagenome]